MKGVLNSKLKNSESFNRKNFDLIKILGAGGGGYFTKYNGKNIEEITKELTIKNIYIKKIPLIYMVVNQGKFNLSIKSSCYNSWR